MRIEQLHYFQTLIQLGSFNKAATALHITQPGLSDAIKSLEKEVGVSLINRSHKGVILTDAGKNFLVYAEQIIEIYDKIHTEIFHNPTDLIGEVRIISANLFADLLLDRLISNFSKTYPKVNVVLVNSQNPEYIKLVTGENYSFGIVSVLQQNDNSYKLSPFTASQNTYSDGLENQLIFQDQLGIVLSKNHPLTTVPILKLEDTKPYKITSFFPDSYSHSSTPPKNVVLVSNSISLHINYFQRRNALSILPYFAYQRYFMHDPSLTFRPLTDFIGLQFHLVYRGWTKLTPVEQFFVKELNKYFTNIANKNIHF